jgi:GNAT superfamily N-acetyltransferase
MARSLTISRMTSTGRPPEPDDPGAVPRVSPAAAWRSAWSPAGLYAVRLELWVDGESIGGLSLVDRGARCQELRGLAVSASWRGQGLGRVLVALAMERTFMAGRTHVRLAADDDGSGALRRWYQALGYYPVGVDPRGRAILESSVSGRHAIMQAARTAKGDLNDERQPEPGLPSDPGHQR